MSAGNIGVLNQNLNFRPLHSNDLMTFESLPSLAQAAFMPGELLQKTIFFAGAMLLRKSAKDHLTLASVRITSRFNRLQRELGIPRPLASSALMTGGTLVAYALYSLSGYSLVSGIIFSVHSIFMRDVAYAPRGPAACGIVSLRGLIERSILPPDNAGLNMIDLIRNQDRKDAVESRAEMVASVALLVASIGLTILFQNPIIASAIAHPLTAIIKAVTLRVLATVETHLQNTQDRVAQQAQDAEYAQRLQDDEILNFLEN